jgi:hypothetical protein
MKPDEGTEPKVGETWEVVHSRKGAFTAEVTSMDAEFVSLRVVKGRAKQLSGPDYEPGDTLQARRSLMRFVERAS